MPDERPERMGGSQLAEKFFAERVGRVRHRCRTACPLRLALVLAVDVHHGPGQRHPANQSLGSILDGNVGAKGLSNQTLD